MTAADVTDFFLALCERANNNVTTDVDALAVSEALGIHAPTVFAHVHALKVHGWIAEAAAHPLGGLHVCVTETGASRRASERTRRAGIAGRKAG